MKKNKSIESLNEELSEFFLSDLEERLETDPMNVGALVKLETNLTAESASGWCIIDHCERFFCFRNQG